jgi:hypothetical protein
MVSSALGREVQSIAGDIFDVLYPALVTIQGIDAQADHFSIPLGELVLESGDPAELGGAHRGEVFGVGEEYGPAVAFPFVEADRTIGGFGCEVGGIVTKADRHMSLLSAE